MKTIAAAAAIILGLAAYSFARLGETEEECEARYGRPVGSDTQTTFYLKDGIRLVVHFFDSKADRIVFTSVRGSVLTEERAKLLVSNSVASRTWIDQDTLAAGKVWATDDGDRWAFYNPSSNTLTVATRKNVERTDAGKRVEQSALLR